MANNGNMEQSNSRNVNQQHKDFVFFFLEEWKDKLKNNVDNDVAQQKYITINITFQFIYIYIYYFGYGTLEYSHQP